MGGNPPAGEADRDREFDDHAARIARAAGDVADNIEGMRREGTAEQRDWQVLGARTLKLSEALLVLIGSLVTLVPILFRKYPKSMTFCSTMLENTFSIVRNCIRWIADLMKVIPANLLDAVKTASTAVVNLVKTLATVTTTAYQAAASVVKAAAGWLMNGVNTLFQMCKTAVVSAVNALVTFIAANPWLCVGVAVGVIVLIGGIYVWKKYYSEGDQIANGAQAA